MLHSAHKRLSHHRVMDAFACNEKRFAIAILVFFFCSFSFSSLFLDGLLEAIVLADMYDQGRESVIKHTSKLLCLHPEILFVSA